MKILKSLDSEKIKRERVNSDSNSAFFNIGSDSTEKITSNYDEYITAENIIKMQKDNGALPFLVGVYYSEQIQSNPGLYRIVTERVSPLTKNEQIIFDNNFTDYYLTENLKKFSGNAFLDTILELARNLKLYDIHFNNIKASDIGRRPDDSLVILNLGSIKNKE